MSSSYGKYSQGLSTLGGITAKAPWFKVGALKFFTVPDVDLSSETKSGEAWDCGFVLLLPFCESSEPAEMLPLCIGRLLSGLPSLSSDILVI